MHNQRIIGGVDSIIDWLSMHMENVATNSLIFCIFPVFGRKIRLYKSFG